MAKTLVECGLSKDSVTVQMRLPLSFLETVGLARASSAVGAALEVVAALDVGAAAAALVSHGPP